MSSPRKRMLSSKHNKAQGVLDVILGLPVIVCPWGSQLFLASVDRNDCCVVSIPSREVHDKRPW